MEGVSDSKVVLDVVEVVLCSGHGYWEVAKLGFRAIELESVQKVVWRAAIVEDDARVLPKVLFCMIDDTDEEKEVTLFCVVTELPVQQSSDLDPQR